MWAPENVDLEPPVIEKIADPEKLLAQIVESIHQRDSKTLKTYILEHKLKEESIFWELVLNLGSCINSDMNEKDPGFFDVCYRCLLYIIKVGNPKELLLALLEQIDNFIDDTKFKNFLPLVQTTILRIPSKLFHSLDIALGTVSSHLKSLPLPENIQLEGDEIKVFHIDKTVVRLTDNLQAFLDFLDPFIEKIDLCSLNQSQAARQEALVLKKHLIKVFDQPLCYLILTYDPQFDKVKSDSRLCTEHAMKLLSKTETDVHKFIVNVKMQINQPESCANTVKGEEIENENDDNQMQVNKEATDTCDIWDFKMDVSSFSTACLVYLIYVEHLGIEKLPFIYRHDYVLELHLDTMNLLMQNTNYPVNFKGLLLCQRLVSLVQKNSITAEHLDNALYLIVINDIINTMINCPVRDHRTVATKVFPLFISRFNEGGRYQIYQSILATNSHSGLKGYTITLIKNDIAQHVHMVKSKEIQHNAFDDYFTGKRLSKILKLALTLPEKETTDMLEHSDQIISCLNLIRFLVIADPKTSNFTGLWDFLSFVENDFLSPLRRGLDLSKAHYQLELNNTQDSKESDNHKGPEMSVSVGGMNLPAMERRERLELLERALNTHHIMHSLLCRVVELIDQQKTQSNESKENNESGETNERQRTSSSEQETESQKWTPESSTDDTEYEHSIKQRILKASLQYVHEYGWTKKAIEAGARDEGLPPVAHGMFPRGGAELINYFYVKSNAELKEYLEKEVEKAKAEGLEKPATKPLIRNAIEHRLRMIIPYLDKWPQAMAIQALPQNAVESWKNLLNLSDEIWYHAGDRSVDFNWYTKRLAVAGVYKSTEIYMVQDKSSDLQYTWDFLDRRLVDLQSFGATKKKCEESSDVFKEAFQGFCIMGRNILGMNSRNR
ncbi:hypothetical protein Btru_032366 [Bulinus truncatus]|nr:hypothetical protein Btru_032366 [Bulinus truncatus]